jgi:hypothetical protein
MGLEIERNHYDKAPQHPLGRVISGHGRRADLDDEPCNDSVADRDAIDLPLFQLTEERIHLGPRRLSSVAHLTHLVEPANTLQYLRIATRPL